MLYDNIAIVGLAHVDAPIELASAERGSALRDDVSTPYPPGLLEGLSGIKSRRLWEEDFSYRMPLLLLQKKRSKAESTK